MNYYNEFDPKAAAWLQQLIDDKQIPYGYVDSRSILEVQPSDLSGFTQCHFFAGIGGWPLALALAGWPADRPVWTASLPCQPFSTAGKQAGTGDDRHLWPVFERLVRECRPPTILGEQVSSKLARVDWFPGVCVDLEALGFAVFGTDLCAPCAGEIGEGRIVRGDQESWERIIIGAPHIRQRLYWVASRMANPDSLGELRDSRRGDEGVGQVCEPLGRGLQQAVGDGAHRRLGDTIGAGQRGGDQRRLGEGRQEVGEQQDGASVADEPCDGRSADGGMGDAELHGSPAKQQPRGASEEGRMLQPQRSGDADGRLAQPRNDGAGKTRRIPESGIFPLAHGIPRGVVPSGDPGDPEYANQTGEARAVRLKGYGNAIVPPLAALFIHTTMEVIDI